MVFEVTDDPADESGRRWDAWIKGILYQFKSWYTWTDRLEPSFLRQILEDYHKTWVGDEMALRWVFETSMDRGEIVTRMKEAMERVRADLRQGREPRVPGYTGGIALFIFSRIESIVAQPVKHP